MYSYAELQSALIFLLAGLALLLGAALWNSLTEKRRAERKKVLLQRITMG